MWTWLRNSARAPFAALTRWRERRHTRAFEKQMRRELEMRRAKIAEERERQAHERDRLEVSAQDEIDQALESIDDDERDER